MQAARIIGIDIFSLPTMVAKSSYLLGLGGTTTGVLNSIPDPFTPPVYIAASAVAYTLTTASIPAFIDCTRRSKI